MESNSSEDEDNDESDHDEEETWTEDAIIHNQFPFLEKYGSHVDVQVCEISIAFSWTTSCSISLWWERTDVNIRK